MNRTTRPLIASPAALLLVPLASLEAADPPALTGSFPLGVYWPWERTAGLAKRNGLEKWAFVERCLDNLKSQGFDAVWAVNLGIPDLPGLAQRMADREMKLVPALGELHYNIDWRRNNWTYLEKESKRALEAAGASPAILAWALCDEPGRDLVGEMETFRRKFIEWGAKQPAVVVTMWPDSPVYAEQAEFGAVCTDIYPFFSAGNPNGPNTPAMSRSWYRRHAQIDRPGGEESRPHALDHAAVLRGYLGPMEVRRAPRRSDAARRVPALAAAECGRGALAGMERHRGGGAGVLLVCLSAATCGPTGGQALCRPGLPAGAGGEAATSVHAPGGLLRPNGDATPECLAVAEAFAAMRRLLPLLEGRRTGRSAFRRGLAAWVDRRPHQPGLNRTFAVVVNDDTDHGQTLKSTC